MRKLVLKDERVRIDARFSEHGSVLQGTKEGRCEGFDIELAIDSDEPAEAIAELIRLAHRMCFTEHAITHEVTITKRHLLNGEVLDQEEHEP
jgi:organic hydroperoxide reductase OsmC/OhrA